MASERILELLRRPTDPHEHEEIRELWKAHSIAEDNRDLPGLIATLTEDCVYTVAGTGARWEGHDGAARFYTELLTAFPDIHFDLDYIVIGPQGVCEEAKVTTTHQGRWLDHEPVSLLVHRMSSLNDKCLTSLQDGLSAFAGGDLTVAVKPGTAPRPWPGSALPARTWCCSTCRCLRWTASGYCANWARTPCRPPSSSPRTTSTPSRLSK